MIPHASAKPEPDPTGLEKLRHQPILVVADLHLHLGSPPAVVADFQRLLRKHPVGLLVINGDLFDLDWVVGERKAGAGAERAAQRVERILDAFPVLGFELCRWVTRGGRIVWLPGNHDAEICLPAVRQLLLRRLGLSADQLQFEDRAFHENGVHIEHGHQHDPDNHFYPDTARAVVKKRLSAFPIGCLMTRYLLCRIPSFKNRGENHAAPFSVLRRVARRHSWSTPKMVVFYLLAALRIALQAFYARRLGDVNPGPEASMSGPWQVVRRMYLDRIALLTFLMVVVLLAVAGVLAPAGLPSLSPATALAVGLPCAALLIRPPSRRRRFFSRDRRACRSGAAQLLAGETRVVVMGHTHHPDMTTGQGRAYVNPGAFFSPGPGGRPYVVVEGTEARLDYLAAVR